MLYLSLIIILLGVVILLYSISVEVRKYSGHGQPPGDIREFDPRPVNGAGMAFNSGYSGDRQRPVSPDIDHADAPAPGGEAPGNEAVHTGQKAMEAQAVFFEDSSGLIDYHLSTGTIDLDPEMTAYKKINRIGMGSLVYEKHGISFYMQNRLYRYDFHRFEDFAMGDNYLAIRLKGARSTKLFIVQNNRQIIAGIGDNYRSYLR